MSCYEQTCESASSATEQRYDDIWADQQNCIAIQLTAFVGFVLMLVLSRYSEKDEHQEYLSILSNEPHQRYKYLVSVKHGSMESEKTGGKVHIRLYGSICDTTWRLLNDGVNQDFVKSRTANFLLTTFAPLGRIDQIEISFNSSSEVSWQNNEEVPYLYVEWIAIQDVIENKKYIFLVGDDLEDGDNWLASLATKSETESFTFLLRSHFWESIKSLNTYWAIIMPSGRFFHLSNLVVSLMTASFLFGCFDLGFLITSLLVLGHKEIMTILVYKGLKQTFKICTVITILMLFGSYLSTVTETKKNGQIKTLAMIELDVFFIQFVKILTFSFYVTLRKVSPKYNSNSDVEIISGTEEATSDSSEDGVATSDDLECAIDRLDRFVVRKMSTVQEEGDDQDKLLRNAIVLMAERIVAPPEDEMPTALAYIPGPEECGCTAAGPMYPANDDDGYSSSKSRKSSTNASARLRPGLGDANGRRWTLKYVENTVFQNEDDTNLPHRIRSFSCNSDYKTIAAQKVRQARLRLFSSKHYP